MLHARAVTDVFLCWRDATHTHRAHVQHVTCATTSAAVICYNTLCNSECVSHTKILHVLCGIPLVPRGTHTNTTYLCCTNTPHMCSVFLHTESMSWIPCHNTHLHHVFGVCVLAQNMGNGVFRPILAKSGCWPNRGENPYFPCFGTTIRPNTCFPPHTTTP